MIKDIYKLKLHECTVIDNSISVMRVPGGWIYDMWNNDTDNPKAGTFVPFDNEFQKVTND